MLNIAGIAGDSIVDGPGIRTTIFAQGCPHHCKGCHNPETWNFGTGKEIAEEELVKIIHSNPLCHGVTFSGGEPFCQADGFVRLSKLLKAQHYELAAYTGYTYEELVENGSAAQKEMLSLLDILIDGPFILEQRSLELNFRGSKNQRIINVPTSLKAGTVVEETSPRWLGNY